MSEFEYLSVLVSIIIGLGLTQILSGVARSVHRRRSIELDPIHSVWSASTFLMLILNWWVFFQSRELGEWTFSTFLVVVSWAVLFYLMAVILYPPDMEEDETYGDVWSRNRRWFMGIWVGTSVLDTLITYRRGDLFNPPTYLPVILHLMVLGLLGVFIRSRRFHLALGIYVLLFALAWSTGVRRLLGV